MTARSYANASRPPHDGEGRGVVKVRELIEVLATMPPDAEVWHLWDGEPRTAIEHVWYARSGCVVTADIGEVCYSTESRPFDAPTGKEDRYWRTPETPMATTTGGQQGE